MPLLFTSVYGVEQTRSSVFKAFLAWLLIAIGIVVLVLNTVPLGKHVCLDFTNIFAGAAGLVTGSSPYKFETVRAALKQHGYTGLAVDDWPIMLPLYPPPTLALYTPLVGMSFKDASIVVYLITTLTCAIITFRLLIASRSMAAIPPLARGLFLMLFLLSTDPRTALHNGNPVLLCAALLLYCIFDERRRPWLHALCFALAVLLKPQISLAFTLPLWIKPQHGKQVVVRAFGIVLLIAVPTLLWCAVHPQLATWPTDIHTNLALGTSQGNSMNATERITVRDPRLNLSYLLGYWTHNARANAWLTGSLLLAFLAALFGSLLAIRKQFANSSYKLAVAFTSVLTLLPVYHRAYDAVVLLLAIPWICDTIVKHQHRIIGWIALISILMNWTVWEWYLPARILGKNGIEEPVSIRLFITHRFHALLTLWLLALLLYPLLKEALLSSPWLRDGPSGTPA